MRVACGSTLDPEGRAREIDAGTRYAVIKGATPGVGAWHGMADEVSDWLKKYL
jgi:hypothetical protein